MAYIKEYWNNKSELSKLAMKETDEREKSYHDEINECENNTIIYAETHSFDVSEYPDHKTDFYIIDSDTTSAASEFSNCGKVALLNFSSYKEPGGRFMDGSKAQEESLCHTSFLYNVLIRFEHSFYDENCKNKNRALYLNRSLYTPNVRFWSGSNTFLCDVITCAAPNKTTAQKYCNVTDKENSRALSSRTEYILNIACENRVNTLILGAWGCGVFGQDSYEVAEVFLKLFNTKYYNFDKVIFAIPRNNKDKNFDNFQKAFKKLGFPYETVWTRKF